MINSNKAKSRKVLAFGILTAVFTLSTAVYAQTAKVGSLQIDNAYTRATAPGQQVAGGFMKIENKGAADQLISASSPAAGELAEINWSAAPLFSIFIKPPATCWPGAVARV